MYILLYVKVIWCNSIPYIYCQLELGGDVFSVYVYSAICETYLVSWYTIDLLSIGVGGISILSLYAFCNMCNLFGAMVFQRSIVNWRGVHVSSVYVHSVICVTYLV